jgi:hypothetical protein
MIATFKAALSGTIWHAEDTNTITGTTDTTTFTINLADGDYKWNCLVYDEAGNSASAPSNYTFTVDTSAPPVYYILTTHVDGNGIVTPTSGSSYLAGTVVDVEAIPDLDWQFDSWSGDLSGTDNTTTITMNGDKSITATFTEIPPAPSGILEDFEAGYTLGQRVGTHADWYDNNAGPLVNSGIGVAGSIGLAAGNGMFTWTAHSFNWNDPSFQAVIFQMDFQSSSSGLFDDDRVAWMIDTGVSSANCFGVQLDHSDGGIATYWRNSGGTRVQVAIVPLTSIIASTFYRLNMKITKLTATSAKIEVTLTQLDSNGNPTGTPVIGSIPDTSLLETVNLPDTKYFTATTMYPTYKNYDTQPGNADNAYYELITSSGPTNTPPVVSDIPNQTIDEGSSFATISLDDYVTDDEDPDMSIIWTFTGNTDLTVVITDRVATITYPGGWIGSETITFTATDTGALFDSDEVTFTVNAALAGVLEDFEAFTPLGQMIGTYSGWYDGGAGPMVTSGVGVASSVGLSWAANIFTWTAHPFDWNAADFLGVNVQMDFQTDANGHYDDDRIGYMITDTSADSTNYFGVQMDPGGSGYNIETYWKSSSNADVRLDMVDLTGLSANSWYRLRLNITKLSATSAKLDVTLTALDINGNPVSIVASGSIADTSTLGSNAPNSKYFTATTIWPAFKNYQTGTVTGSVDNAYIEIITTT